MKKQLDQVLNFQQTLMNKTNLKRITEIKEQLKFADLLREKNALNDQGRKFYDELLSELLDLEVDELRKEHQEKAKEFRKRFLDLLSNSSDQEIENVFGKKIADFTPTEIIWKSLGIILEQPCYSPTNLFKLLREEYFRLKKASSNDHE